MFFTIKLFSIHSWVLTYISPRYHHAGETTTAGDSVSASMGVNLSTMKTSKSASTDVKPPFGGQLIDIFEFKTIHLKLMNFSGK